MAYFRHSKYTHVIKLMMALDSFPPILFYNTNCDSFTHVILKDSNMHCRYEKQKAILYVDSKVAYHPINNKMLYEIFWARYSFITSRALQIKEQSNYKYVMQNDL